MSQQEVLDVLSRIVRSGDLTATQLTLLLHRELGRAGWPGDVVSGMSVVHDSGSFSVVCAPEAQDGMHLAEYGTEDGPGTSAVHDFCTRVLPAVAPLHERAAMMTLGGLL